MLDLYVGEALRSDPESEYLRAEAVAALHREIHKLPAEDRQLVEARYWQGLKWKDIAEQLRITEETARQRDYRIRDHLCSALVAWDRVRPLRRGP